MQKVRPWIILLILGIWSAGCTPIVDDSLIAQNSPLVLNLKNNETQISENYSQPNFLFISIDDLNMSPSIYGGQAKTPNIDALARQGALFTDAHVNGVRCNPSRTSLVTGLRPTSTGIFANSQSSEFRDILAMSDSPAFQNFGRSIRHIVTLPQHLRSNGYYVAASGKLYHGPKNQRLDGWDAHYGKPAFIKPANKPMSGFDPAKFENWDWGAVEAAVHEDDPDRFYQESDLTDYQITQEALKMIPDLPDEQPFFMAVGFSLPHSPLYIPQRSIDLYKPGKIQLPPILEDDTLDLPDAGVALVESDDETSDQYFADKKAWREMIAHYYGAVSYVDEQIGMIMEAFAAHNHLENTIIIVWSDHGFHLGEKDRLFKGSLWQETTHVPFIVVAPEIISAGSIIDAPVNAVDIFPTITELAGLDMPTDFPRDGRSFVRLLQDPEAFWPWPAVSSRSLNDLAIRTRDWSYIRYNIPRSVQKAEGIEEANDDRGDPPIQAELYNRPTDPNEWHNLLSAPDGPTTYYQRVTTDLDAMLLGLAIPNAAPRARRSQVELANSGVVPIRLRGKDANEDFLLFTITTLPRGGQLYSSVDGINVGEKIVVAGTELINYTRDAAYVLYKPELDTQTDSFSFTVSDGISQHESTVAIRRP